MTSEKNYQQEYWYSELCCNTWESFKNFNLMYQILNQIKIEPNFEMNMKKFV